MTSQFEDNQFNLNFPEDRKAAVPTLELRIPISPRDSDMRMVRYLLESVQQFGGPISRAAHCVLSISAVEPPRDLREEFAWTADHSIDFRWVDPDLFQRWTYDATGFDRFWVESDADIVALMDADLLVAGDFDNIVKEAYQKQRMLGFMAHVSPFGFDEMGGASSDEWWERMFDAAGLATPSLDWQYSAWGLDFSKVLPHRKVRIIKSLDPNHRYGPPYFNYGVIIGPRPYFERMGETFIEELEAVGLVVDTIYTSQMANCLAFERHQIPCGTIPINYNFPMNIPSAAIRSVNPDPNGEDSDEDIRIFHFIRGRKHFKSAQTVLELLNRTDLTGAWRVFQDRLKVVSSRIGEA